MVETGKKLYHRPRQQRFLTWGNKSSWLTRNTPDVRAEGKLEDGAVALRSTNIKSAISCRVDQESTVKGDGVLISIRIDSDYDDFGVAWALQPMKAETKFVSNFTGWKARATFGCGCRGRKNSAWLSDSERSEQVYPARKRAAKSSCGLNLVYFRDSVAAG